MKKTMSGYQEILDQNILYVIIEKFVKPIPSPWIEAIRNLYAIAIWNQIHQKLLENTSKQCNRKTDASKYKKNIL